MPRGSNRKATREQVEFIKSVSTPKEVTNMMETFNVNSLCELPKQIMDSLVDGKVMQVERHYGVNTQLAQAFLWKL